MKQHANMQSVVSMQCTALTMAQHCDKNSAGRALCSLGTWPLTDVRVFVRVSVVVRVDAELNERSVEDVVECEERIVLKSRDLLPASSVVQIQHKVDELNALLRRLGLDTRLVILLRANSIAVFFTCMTLSAVMSLRHHWCTGRLKDIVEKLFIFLAGYTEVRVKRLTWPVSHYERCWKFFNSLQGKQTD